MCTLAVHWCWLDTVPGFPDRLRENPPRQGFFEHPEYLAVRAHMPALVRRGDVTVWLSSEAIAAWTPAGAGSSPPVR